MSVPPQIPRPPLSSTRFWTLWAAGFILWVGALALASSWDLPLSAAVADRTNLFGRLVAHFGEWPAWVVVAFSLGALVFSRRENSRWRGVRPLFSAILILALVHPLAITQTLKFTWGRVRFVQLAGSLSAYTPFYMPAGPGAGESFPSGHVAMALSLAPIPFYLARRRGAAAALSGLGLVLAYGVTVALGRIIAGAHFLTDCLFPAGLAFLLAAPLTRWLLQKLGRRPSPAYQ